MTAPKLILLRSKQWDAIWIDYLRGGKGATFTALAETHGVHRTTIARYAKAHGWAKRREIERARRWLRQHEEGLAFARSVAIEAARHMIALCRDRSTTLATLRREAEEASHAIWTVGGQASLLAGARDRVRRAEAGDLDAWVHAEAGFPPRDPRYERPTRWPEHEAMIHGYRGGRDTATVRAFKAGKLRVVRPATA